MKIYQKYVNERQAALNIFHVTKNRLASLYDKLTAEHKRCSDVIAQHVDQQKFLENEMAETHNSIQQINRVVGATNEH